MDSTTEPPRALIELEGEYDIARRDELARAFASLGNGPATIDLSRVTYLDSIFMQQLVLLYRRLVEHGVTLKGANENVLKLLRIAGLDQFFHFVE
jgi:anti-anti-sigma factor